MVCWLKIKQLEKQLGRKLTEKEKRKIREKMHHVEIRNEDNEKEKIEVVA